jgi:NAD(P)-dependent dehydrogenase (short-subunit alcohol dehydrogenase family)
MDYSFNFNGASAIVSGGASGIGKAIAEALLCAGAAVSVFDLDKEKGEKAFADWALAHPGRVAFIPCDLRVPQDVDAGVADTVARFGPPDFLVNSIAVTRRKPALEHSDEDIDAVMQTNFSGVFRLCKSFAQSMILAEPGPRMRKIVNIASTGAFSGSRNFSAYNASKAALVALTKVLANEWYPRGIVVNAVCPGPTDTPFTRDYYQSHPEAVQGIISRTPAGRIANPDDMVGPVLFLLSSASDWIAGEAIVLDGGKGLNS